ncbi:MAG: hypothetical protein IAE80_17660 [Anaerolinea sp.]|nr:hypothetical protein [Anaerolinea sp.]
MAESVLQTPSTVPTLARSQRLAWGVLLVSFAVFCVICVVSVIGAYLFMFESVIPMQSLLRVGRGTAVVVGADMIEQGVRVGMELFNSALISTDPISQATLTIHDQQRDNTVVALVTLKSGSAVDMTNVTRPRFDWSTAAYWVDLESVYGDLDIFIPDNLGRSVVITLRTTQGVSVWLTESGQYAIQAIGSQVQVSNNGGSAVIVKPGQQESSRVPIGYRVTYQIDTDSLTTTPARVNLLGDRSFTTANVTDYNAVEPVASSLTWRCNSVENDAPEGNYALAVEDGRASVQFLRNGGATSHAETSCSIAFGRNGLDVSHLSYLSIRATFKINGHSLSTCGSRGSECPLMLRMDYFPLQPTFSETGQPELVSWYHGFFSTFKPELEYPLICDSAGCTAHEIVNEDTWYTYESGNLLSDLTPQQRPSAITVVRFYASGHEYDVDVSEMALLANGVEIPAG